MIHIKSRLTCKKKSILSLIYLPFFHLYTFHFLKKGRSFQRYFEKDFLFYVAQALNSDFLPQCMGCGGNLLPCPPKIKAFTLE